MALLQNITLRAQYPIRESGGTTGFERSSVGRLERHLNRFAGDGGLDSKGAIPYGYQHPSALFLARVTGGLGSHGLITGTGGVSASNLAGGFNLSAPLTGTGAVTPAPVIRAEGWILGALAGTGTVSNALGVPIAVAVAALAGSGSVSDAALIGRANIIAALVGSGTISNAAADAIATAAISAALSGSGGISSAGLLGLGELISALAGSGTVTDAAGVPVRQASAALVGSGVLAAAVNALGHLDAMLAGSGDAAVTVRAIGELEAAIKSYGTLSPESLRDAVWQAGAAAYNDPGTMGNKLNSASSAGDPWTAELPGLYPDGSAGKMLADILGDAVLLRKMESGRWRIVANQMIFYDEDGTTPLRTFDLKDSGGNPSMSSVFERVPV